MAITSAICNSFKQEILEAEHNFTASSGNTFNLALYDSDATLNKSTTVYTTSEELATITSLIETIVPWVTLRTSSMPLSSANISILAVLPSMIVLW